WQPMALHSALETLGSGCGPHSSGRALVSHPGSVVGLPLASSAVRAVLRPDVDHGQLPTLDRLDSPLESGGKVGRALDRPLAREAEGAGDGGEVDLWILHPLGDPAVLRRPIAQPSNAVLMVLVVEIGAVIV